MSADRPWARLPRTVVLLGFTSFLTDVGSDMIFPLLPVFVAETLGGGAAYLGIIEGAADTVASLLKLFSGGVSDRLGRRKPLIVAGYGIATVVRPLVALATAPVHVLVVRVLDRTGKGIRSSPRDALIAEAAEPEQVGRAFGFHRAMDHAGAVVGPLLATAVLAAHGSTRQVFWVAAVPGALAVAVLLLVREAQAAVRPAPSTPPLVKAALSQRAKAYLAIVFLFSLANSSDAFLLLRAKQLGISIAALPTLWATLHVAKVLWSYAGGVWADRVPRVRLIVIGWLIYALSYLGLGYADRPWEGWVLFAVYGAFYGLSEPAEKALMKDLSAPGAKGASFGWYNFVVGIASLPAGMAMGWIWWAHGPRLALTIGAGVALLGAILLMTWERSRLSGARDVATT